MILFKYEHVKMIQDGVKTQTRRPTGRHFLIGTVHYAKTSYRKDACFGFVKVNSVRQERLGDISLSDCVKEGYETKDAYVDIFKKIYGEWNPDRIVQVIDFEYLEQK